MSELGATASGDPVDVKTQPWWNEGAARQKRWHPIPWRDLAAGFPEKLTIIVAHGRDSLPPIAIAARLYQAPWEQAEVAV